MGMNNFFVISANRTELRRVDNVEQQLQINPLTHYEQLHSSYKLTDSKKTGNFFLPHQCHHCHQDHLRHNHWRSTQILLQLGGQIQVRVQKRLMFQGNSQQNIANSLVYLFPQFQLPKSEWHLSGV